MEESKQEIEDVSDIVHISDLPEIETISGIQIPKNVMPIPSIGKTRRRGKIHKKARDTEMIPGATLNSRTFASFNKNKTEVMLRPAQREAIPNIIAISKAVFSGLQEFYATIPENIKDDVKKSAEGYNHVMRLCIDYLNENFDKFIKAHSRAIASMINRVIDIRGAGFIHYDQAAFDKYIVHYMIASMAPAQLRLDHIIIAQATYETMCMINAASKEGVGVSISDAIRFKNRQADALRKHVNHEQELRKQFEEEDKASKMEAWNNMVKLLRTHFSNKPS
jgi:hypothetical protein